MAWRSIILLGLFALISGLQTNRIQDGLQPGCATSESRLCAQTCNPHPSFSMTDYAELPPLLKEIADLVGVDNAVELSKKLGGRRIRIPSRHTMSDNHLIAQVIGIKPALKIASMFVGTRIEIPVFGRKLERDNAIRQAYADGESVSGIANRFCVSGRNVRRILKQK